MLTEPRDVRAEVGRSPWGRRFLKLVGAIAFTVGMMVDMHALPAVVRDIVPDELLWTPPAIEAGDYASDNGSDEEDGGEVPNK